MRAFPDLDGTWPGGVVVTGAHVDSLAALQAGTVDIAAIDAVTFALVRRFRPALPDGLVVIAEGPRIPCLPLIADAEHDRRRTGSTARGVRHGGVHGRSAATSPTC